MVDPSLPDTRASESATADLGVLELSHALEQSRVSSEELTNEYLERIARRDPAYGAWLNVYADAAIAAARSADGRRRQGKAETLTGIPIGLKDVIGVAGLPLTADSPLLKGNIASQDSFVWTKLRDAGMVLIGHLHCGEFCLGTWGANPWNTSFTPGGSSSGSGVAVAARTVPAALGTDARGSIRCPADVNGITGLKPTFGLVSMSGCIGLTFSYEVLGPIAQSAADCSALLSAIAGPDPNDCRTLVQRPPSRYPLRPPRGSKPLMNSRIGVPSFADDYLSPGVALVFNRFQSELEGLGAELVQFERPPNPLEANSGAGAGWQTLLGAEAKVLLSQFAGRESLHRPEFAKYFEGMTAGMGDAHDYVLAQVKRAELVAAWRKVFHMHQLDAVIEPGSTAEMRYLPGPDDNEQHPFDTAAYELLYGMWSDTNFPVLAVPGGPSPTDGGPVGIEIVGLPYQEGRLLTIGIAYQSATDYHRAIPTTIGTDLEPYVPAATPDGGTQPSYRAVKSPFEAVMPRP